LTAAIADYQKYLDLAPDADDREKVLEKIEVLKTQTGVTQ
jgi:hypothetical protein